MSDTQDKTQQGTVTTSVDQGIATISFYHPAHNSLPGKLLAKLRDAIDEAGTNDAVKVIILKSSGDRTFCAVVVGPAVERKLGTSAMTQLAYNATEWRSAEWACAKGLYASIYDNVEEMDLAVLELAQKLAQSNPEAMRMMKKAFWSGTENWDELLAERAATSGQLVLSDFTRSAIQKFKSK